MRANGDDVTGGGGAAAAAAARRRPRPRRRGTSRPWRRGPNSRCNTRRGSKARRSIRTHRSNCTPLFRRRAGEDEKTEDADPAATPRRLHPQTQFTHRVRVSTQLMNEQRQPNHHAKEKPERRRDVRAKTLVVTDRPVLRQRRPSVRTTTFVSPVVATAHRSTRIAPRTSSSSNTCRTAPETPTRG